MLFSKISGLRREGNFIFIRGEYHDIKFHVNEIASIRIADWNDSVYAIEQLPLKNAKLIFILKSGKRKTCYVHRLSLRKYKWLLNLLNKENQNTA